jgi:methionyl-tRNA formyltransferase
MPAPARNRVVLLGMRCAFTAPVLEALLDEPGVNLQAVVLPSPPAPARPAPGDPLLDLASRHDIPIHEVGNRFRLNAPGFRAALNAIAPDLIVVACFPWRLPVWLRALPTAGCVNIHPSLLPDGRGPEPVFWTFRRGLTETGVTLHLMDEGFDAGPIVAQRRQAIPDDATLESLERDLARLGVQLLIDTLPALPIPGPDDLIVPTIWGASRAARFIRAVTPMYGPLTVVVQATGQRLAVSEVIESDDGATLPVPVRREGPLIRIRFTPGVVTVRTHAPTQPLALHRSGR